MVICKSSECNRRIAYESTELYCTDCTKSRNSDRALFPYFAWSSLVLITLAYIHGWLACILPSWFAHMACWSAIVFILLFIVSFILTLVTEFSFEK